MAIPKYVSITFNFKISQFNVAIMLIYNHHSVILVIFYNLCEKGIEIVLLFENLTYFLIKTKEPIWHLINLINLNSNFTPRQSYRWGRNDFHTTQQHDPMNAS